MANCQTDCCNFIRGEVYISESKSACSKTLSSILNCKGASSPMRKIGNVETLTLSIESEIRGLASKTNFIESLACATSIVNNVGLSMTINCIDKENLKLGLYGTSQDLSESGSVSGEKYCGEFKKCYYTRTQKCGISNLVLEIEDNLGNVVLTLVEGEDYTTDSFGFEFLNTINLASNQFLVASYDYDESSYRVTQPLTETKGPFNIYFKGTSLNGQKDYHVELFKVILQPASLLEIISSDNFQSFEFNGTLMRDCTKGQGLSEFLEIKESINGDGCN